MIHRRVFIRQIGLAGIGCSLWPEISIYSKPHTTKLPRSTPEAQGVSTSAIERYFDAIEKSGQEFHATMIVKNGHVIAEAWWAPYRSDHRMQLYSMSKSFTSTAIGFAQQEKLLNVEDNVIDYFKDVLPDKISDHLKALKIKHLLMMGVGMAKDSIMIIEGSPTGTPWSKTFLSLPIDFEPGTKFLYNSGASFMLSNIVQKVSGLTVHDYLRPRLYEPLGIVNTTWSTNPEGINFGASHLRLTTEDMAKFGQFYLQKGIWKGKQLLNQDYIHTATTKQISNGNSDGSWSYGYGYQFWLNPPGGFRADGAFGQYSMVFPEQNAVVAINSESLGKVETMSIVWNVLWPELNKKSPIQSNTVELNKLKKRLEHVHYDPPQYVYASDREDAIENKTFHFDENDLGIETITFQSYKKTISFIIKEKDLYPYTITCGRNKWISKGNIKPLPHSLFSRRRIDFDSITAAACGWETQNTLKISLRFIETCHSDYLTCVFDGDTINISPLFSVLLAQKKADDRKDLIGHL